MIKSSKLFLIIAPLVASLGIGCSTLQQSQTPTTVQAEITAIGALNIANIPAKDKAYVHTFATQLLALSTSQVDSSTITSLVPSSLPTGVSPYVPLLIAVAVNELNSELKILGAHNQNIWAYAQGVANGLLAAGF